MATKNFRGSRRHGVMQMDDSTKGITLQITDAYVPAGDAAESTSKAAGASTE